MPPERDLVYLWDMLTAAKGIVASVQSRPLSPPAENRSQVEISVCPPISAWVVQ